MLDRPVTQPEHWSDEAAEAAKRSGYIVYFALATTGESLWDFERFAHVPMEHAHPVEVLDHVRASAPPWWDADSAIYASYRGGPWYPRDWDEVLGKMEVPPAMVIDE
jgi:hypothetical protein